jgi:D-alanyl-lipoteichoic acid acyltransferase DltB (MBOAT superfamily)
MLFNSYEFILGFLPATVALFFLAGRFSRTAGLTWLILASLFFYAWWRPLNVAIIAPSIVVNFLLARLLMRQARRGSPAVSRAVLLLGIAFNIAFLGYFKYANFAVMATNDVFGTRYVLAHIVLPLGISFITFQKIAFLIDVHAGRVDSFTLREYCLFVLFFPQLIAGPIVHFREMMPQFRAATCAFDAQNLAVGITLFLFGLFKKVALADNIAPSVSAIFEQAAAGQPVTLLAAWAAALGFTLQIYFDFSGYTDMALGIARLFGMRLPPNFNSPLKSTSIIEFWLRWHMTLTRFLTAYIYNPLALALTRRRMAHGHAVIGRRTTLGAFAYLLAFPTLLTMIVSGVWHGAGYLFIVWGLMHGVYLTVNHAWRAVGPKLWHDRRGYERFMKPAGFVVTLTCVVVSMVVFRAQSVAAASAVFHGMLGMNGIALPPEIYDRFARLGSWFHRAGIARQKLGDFEFVPTALWLALLAFIAFACPNSLQVLSRYEPALGWKADWTAAGRLGRWLTWEPSLGWAAVACMLALAGIFYLGGQSEFLYWQF